ncbi:MAG: DUF1015 domain-containing protein [Chitinivibrionales bacterium]|nr:DUF1015 domain-containing protein [Chitinivibrionales bacterium]
MAQIKPFCGYRYNLAAPHDLGNVVSPPYDMLSAAAVDELYNRDSRNVARIIQNKAQPADKANVDRHLRAAGFFKEWIKSGILARDAEPALYGYLQRFSVRENGREVAKARHAVIALLKLVDFSAGVVLPHEYTLSAPKQDRLDHMQALHANTELIFGVVADKGDLFTEIKQCCAGPVVGSFTDEQQVTHELFTVTDQALIARCMRAAADRTVLIADGHHRYETALRYSQQHPGEANASIMAALVSMNDPGLVILPFHRLMRKSPAKASLDIMASLRLFFNCAECGKADLTILQTTLAGSAPETLVFLDKKSTTLFTLSLNAQGRAFLEQNRGEHSLRWMELGMSLVNTIFVQGVLGLTPDPTILHDMIEYSKDTTEAFRRSMQSDEWYGTFFLRPATMADIEAIVKGGERMPQKSTNFFPKFYSGLVFNVLENA